MKKIVAVLFGGIIVISAAVFIIVHITTRSHFQAQQADTPKTIQCTKIGFTRTVHIAQNTITPQHLTAKACDQLVLINDDDVTRLMAFGRHDHHQAYDGVTEKILTKGQSLNVALNELGTYTFHDHLHDQLIGQLTVTE